MMASTIAVGFLMTEHRLILRMVADMRWTLDRAGEGAEVDPAYIQTAVDFLRSYADRCHHGKEEDILFRDLANKPLAPGDAAAMQGLIDDHAWARATTRRLIEANDAHAAGDESAHSDVVEAVRELVLFYPVHIEKEDHGFFRPAFDYFTNDERVAMAEEFREFDRMLIHEKYRQVVEGVEARHR